MLTPARYLGPQPAACISNVAILNSKNETDILSSIPDNVSLARLALLTATNAGWDAYLASKVRNAEEKSKMAYFKKSDGKEFRSSMFGSRAIAQNRPAYEVFA